MCDEKNIYRDYVFLNATKRSDKGISRKIPTSVIYSTHCITNAILCSKNNNVYHISEEVLPSIEGEV
jgi:hypothetical protein